MTNQLNLDSLTRFLFENRPIRGEMVTVEQSYQSILNTTEYPLPVQTLLGELLAAACLLTATLKFEGEIALQIQSEGPIKYAIVNGNHQQQFKGVARYHDGTIPESFSQWFKKGVLAITLTPKDGQRYQGMVALDKACLSDCLEDYFLQSEQLLTHVSLAAKSGKNARAAGFLVQIVPTESEASNVTNNPDFEHVAQLANTIQNEELLTLAHVDMIHRLYHEDEIRVFDAQNVSFYCDCSRERSAQALKNVNKSELLDIIKEDGNIKMDCQFCHQTYQFDAIDIENIHSQNLHSGNA